MKRIVLVPDSYKGSLSSSEICAVIKNTILELLPECEVICIPVADGGEGSVDCFLEAMQGEKIHATVSGPFGEPMRCYYGACGDFAVVEMASCAGLPLVEGNQDPLKATTYGVGELILDALRKGFPKIIIGLGGSATNDAGCGMACALGVKFYDKNGKEFFPTGGTLHNIFRIDASGIDPAVLSTEIVAMCDISNPLYGEDGAAWIFGPQKGADHDMVLFLDEGLRHLSEMVKKDLGIDIASLPGSGAAGGMGGGLVAFLDAKLQMGIDTVLESTNFSNIIKDADLVITGEGRLDSQTLRGKVACGVGRAAERGGVPAIAIVGSLEPGFSNFSSLGLSAVWDTVVAPMPLADALTLTRSNIALMTRNAINFCHAILNK